MRALCLISLLLLLPAAPGAADTLDDALQKAGLKRSDLGWTPRGWWSRWPRPVQHKLQHFDDLFAEPLATVPFTRTMANAVRQYLGPGGLDKKGTRGSGALYGLVYALGVERKYGGFRSYNANLIAKETPLDEAIVRLYRYAGRKTKFVTFGTESPYPLIEKELEEAAGKLPPKLSMVLGKLVLDIVDAHHWATLAFRNVSLEDRVAVSKRLDLGAEAVDALEYAHQYDDVAKAWDEASLWYAGLKCVEALDMARRALAGIEAPSDLSFDWQTPLGWIRVRGRAGNAHEAHQLEDLLLLVDLGGHDAYLGPLASATPTQPISLCLDLSGNDTYASRGVGQAVGRCGIGILLDVSGDDKYEGKDHAQGVGQFGMGVLIDLAGNDMYMARWSAQGCAYFGIGLLIDRLGTDDYAIQADGQGFGGPGGVGVLADYSGNDHYTAEPDGELSGRPSYHSKLKISVSNAQGCSMGRRADGSDGHNWAGGLGALIDIAGNDTYVAGNWCHGTGYWFGMGVLYDGSGDDSYEGHVWSQATGAHFCIGLLLDEGGNDTHTSKSHNSLAFGHDFTHALLINLGGDDKYWTPKDGLGFSINRSVAALIDVGGNDRYSLKMTPPAEGQAAPEPKTRPGFARYDKLFADTQGLNTYWVDSTSLGLFLDIGGDDLYHADGNVGKAMDLNGQSWGDGPGSDNWKVRNHGIGVDVAEGSIDWRALPVKGPRR